MGYLLVIAETGKAWPFSTSSGMQKCLLHPSHVIHFLKIHLSFSRKLQVVLPLSLIHICHGHLKEASTATCKICQVIGRHLHIAQDVLVHEF